jgi:hypothetical protein
MGGNASSQYEIEVTQWELKEWMLEGPSWSWAAADIRDWLEFWAANTEKRLPRIWKAQDADILDVDLELFGQNPFGRVKSGRLIVRGFTYPRSDVGRLAGIHTTLRAPSTQNYVPMKLETRTTRVWTELCSGTMFHDIG